MCDTPVATRLHGGDSEPGQAGTPQPSELSASERRRRHLKQTERDWVGCELRPSTRGGAQREVRVVQPAAVAVPPEGLPREIPLGVGRHPQHPVRPGQGPRDVQHVPRPTRVRRLRRLRRDRLQRAPPERLRPDAEPQPDRRHARPPHHAFGDLRDRQLDRRLQPAEPRGRGVRDARLHLGRTSHRRVPGRHADGHQLLHGPDPRPHPRQVRRGARPDHPGVDPREPVRVRRQVQPVALRQHVAVADPEAAPADLHPRRRLDRDVGLLPRPRLQLQLPVVLRVQGRQGAARRVLGAAGRARRRRREPVPGELRPDRVRRRHRRRGREALRRAHPLLLQQLPAHPSRLRRPARLPHDQHHQGQQAEPAPSGDDGDVPGPHVARRRRQRAGDRREPRHRRRADGGARQDAARRHRVLPPAHGRHDRLEDPLLDPAVRREGDAAAEGHLVGVRRQQVVVPAARGPAGQRRGQLRQRPSLARVPGRLDPEGAI